MWLHRFKIHCLLEYLWWNSLLHHFHQIFSYSFINQLFFHQIYQGVQIPTTRMYFECLLDILQHHTNGLIHVHFFSSKYNTCSLFMESEVSYLQSTMCSFVVRLCKGRSQPMNIRGCFDIKYLILFHLFDVDFPSSTILYFFYLNSNPLSYPSHIFQCLPTSMWKCRHGCIITIFFFIYKIGILLSPNLVFVMLGTKFKFFCSCHLQY